MSLVTRVKNIILTPKSEWPVIAAEPASTGGLLAGYVAPLAAIGILAGFVGHSIIGYSMPFMGTVRMPIIAGLSVAVFSYIMVFVGVFIIAAIVNALAPTFGGQKDFLAALKVTVYSQTPGWVASVITIIPMLGILVLIAMLYGLYLLYLGLPVLMKNPEDKSIGYTAVTVICAIVVYVVVGVLATAVTGMFGGAMLSGMAGAGMGSGMGSGRNADVIIDKNSSLGKLQEFGKKMEEQSKKLDEANKSGDAQATTKAAGDVLGTLLGGGKRIEPLQIEEIKPFVPETFGGLARKSNKTERSGFAGVQVTKAEAGYGDGSGKSINLEVTDTGGIGGLMMFAGWANVQGEKEDENSKEVTRKDGGRLIHEKVSKTGGTNEFDLVIGDRFLVGTRGSGGVTLDQLKSAVSTLDLAKLESMKDVGVQK
jgi:Yip1 domain